MTLNKTRLALRCWPFCVALVLPFEGWSQHSDIAVYSIDDRVSSHSSTGGQAETDYFLRNFDFWGPPLNIYAGDDPGFQMSGTNPPAGYSSLPGNQTLTVEAVPFHVPGAPAGNILFWDGVSAQVEFDALPDGHMVFLEDAASIEIMLDGSLDRFGNLVGGITNSSGGLHEHLTVAVENGGAAPIDGFYMLGWQLSAPQRDASALVTVVLSTPSIPSSIDTAVSSWLQANSASITMAGDFDDSGKYELADVDALVASIASGGNDPLFDLSGDGLTDVDDLTLWREIAGSALNALGGPVLPGDANLDGAVDDDDFAIWHSNKFTNTPAWSAGDFTADGIVNGRDFLVWNTFKSMQADGLGAVPEPRSFVGLALLAIVSIRSWPVSGGTHSPCECGDRRYAA